MPSRGCHVQTPRGRRATELGCDAGCEGGRLGDEGHAGQEARARKPQGPRGGGNFILREVETQGTWEQGAGRVIHFRGRSPSGYSESLWGQLGARRDKRGRSCCPGASNRGSRRSKAFVGGSAVKAGSGMDEAPGKGQAALAVLTDLGSSRWD